MRPTLVRSIVLGLLLAGDSGRVAAQSDTTRTARPDSARPLVRVRVVGRVDDLRGIARTASEGRIGAADLRRRPLAREAELLETVPGLIATQHSGDGKSNQLFVRGFNLDHGTDFQTRVEGMPVNMASHAHGQGYTDLDFLILELVDHLERVVAAGVTWSSGTTGPSAAIRLRHFGAYPLVEDNVVRASATTLVNGSGGFSLGAVRLQVAVLNLLGGRANDIQYYYASRLPGEPAGGVHDIHFHPVEPRQLRLSLVRGL